MWEEMLVRQCAPTLSGLKTGNLFTVPCEDPSAAAQQLGRLNRLLGPKGLRILPMRYSQKRVLIYAYRPKLLRRDLADGEASRLLCGMGYSSCQPDRCVAQLGKRLRSQAEFPHEVGLFLGYPPEDVEGFIQNRADCYKCVGCWKVYGDPERAQETFRSYKACTRSYCQKWRDGATLQGLTVAV